MPFKDTKEVWELRVCANGSFDVRGLDVSDPKNDAVCKAFLSVWMLASRAARLGKPFSITFADVEDFNREFGTKWAEDCPVDEVIVATKQYFAKWQPSPLGAPDSIVSGTYDKRDGDYGVYV
jgi:hypothetical protein